MDIDTSLIKVNKRKRQIDPVKVAELAGSINEIGLLCPIVVRSVNEHFDLVAGAHRLEAFKLLGRTTILAEVFDGSDLDAELAEIDENLKRAELTVLEQGEFLSRRNEILIERGERASDRMGRPRGVTVTPLQSTSDIASEIGLSESSTHQRMQIANDIAPDVKDAIRDTPIADSTTQLLALARMDRETQRAVIEKIGDSGKTIKQAIQDLRDESKRVVPFPTGKYQVVYADPPWKYDNSGFNESAENQYPTMTTDEICALPIESLCTDESILFLWATNPLLEDALQVMRAWGFCCAIGTRILTDDLKWVNAETIKIGDRLLSFDEEQRNGRRYFKWGVVLGTGIESHPCYEIEMSSGNKLICTGDHAWLMRTSLTGRESICRWIKTNTIEKHMNHPNRSNPLGIMRLVPVAIQDSSYESGFLAGAFDSEGSWRKTKGGLMFSQKDNALLRKVSDLLHMKEYSFSRYANKTNNVLQLGLTGGVDMALRFLMECRPPRLMEQWLKTDISKMSLYNRCTDSIVAIKMIGKCDVVVLTTSTGTYFAEGYGAHNTYKTNMAWIKDKARGKGWFLKSKHELLLIGTRENTPHPADRPDSCFEADRGDVHSRKPECVYGIIESMYPGKKVELFARKTQPRDGWIYWGNEL